MTKPPYSISSKPSPSHSKFSFMKSGAVHIRRHDIKISWLNLRQNILNLIIGRALEKISLKNFKGFKFLFQYSSLLIKLFIKVISNIQYMRFYDQTRYYNKRILYQQIQMKYLKSKHLAFLLLVFFIVSSQDIGSNQQPKQGAGQNPQQQAYKYKVGQVIEVKLQSQKAFIALAVGQINQKYLFLNIIPSMNNKLIPINLYLFRNEQTNPFKKCQNNNVDSCYLANNQLKRDQTILLIAECESNCQFRFRTYWSNIQHLKVNTTTKFYFSKQQQKQLYHLELQDKQFNQLRIIMKPETRRNPFDKIKIYGKFGSQSEPTAQNYDFKSIHLWEDGQGIFLNPKQLTDVNINIFIVGQTQTVYQLTCQVIKQKHHDIDLGEVLDQYLDPQQNALYHAKFFQDQAKKAQTYDEYILMISGFSGKLNVNFFLDSDKKHPYQIQPFQYVSDVQYTFKKQDLAARKITEGIYIYVNAFQRKSVFTIKFYGRGKTSAIKLHEHIYEFIQVSKQQVALAYFQAFYWIDSAETKFLDFSVHTTDVVGKNQLSFRICKGEAQSCTNRSIYQKFSAQINNSQTLIGTKRTYHLQISKQNLGQLNQVQSQLTILIMIKNIHVGEKQKLKNGVVAIQYISENRIQYLRQDRPIQTRIKTDQYKVYKFVNEDPQVNAVKIYLNEIAGNVVVRKVRSQPKQGQVIGDIQKSNIISIVDNLTKNPIFIIVIGIEQAIFSLQLQILHNQDASLSTFILTQDVQFKLRIKPQSQEIAQLHPIFDDIYFQYKSTGVALACQLLNNGKCKSQDLSNLNNEGKVTIRDVKQRVKMIKLLNPSFKDTIQVKMLYHSRDLSHCESREIGKLYLQTIKSSQKQQANSNEGNCWNFQSFKSKDIQIYISRPDLGQLHYAVIVCNNLVKGEAQNFEWNIKISKETIQKYCSSSNIADITLFTGPHKQLKESDKNILPFKLKYLIEYVGEQTVTIPDGVSYTVQKKVTDGPLKTFYYDFVNKKDTSVTIQQLQGNIFFSAYIVQSSLKQKELYTNTYDLISQQGSFFLNPVLKIQKQDLDKKKCEQCSVIVKVYSKSEINHMAKFSIQITQNFIELQDHSVSSNFLTKNSLAYYSFKYANSVRKGSLIIQIEDNKQNCANIYLSDIEYPDQKAYIAKQIEAKQLIYTSPKQMTYYISVKAVQDCPYTITVSSTKTQITKLQKGKYSYIQLQKGQVRYYMLHNSLKQHFKLLAVNQYGQLYFYMNYTTPTQLQNLMGQQTISFRQFKIQSQYPNRLVMHDGNKDLCQNCFYIVAVEARAATTGSIFYGGNSNSISIMSDTKINDYLSMQNQTFKGSFYGSGNIIAEIEVLYGTLQLSVDYANNKSQKSFLASKQLYLYEFQLPMPDETFWSKPAAVQFKAKEQQTVYSVVFRQKQVLPQINFVDQTSIQSGQPNYFQLKPNFTQCLNGFLREELQKIFVSSDIDRALTLEHLQITTKINDKDVKIVKERVRNILSIRFQPPQERILTPASYQICIKLKQNQKNLQLTASQNNNLNILPPDSEVLVEGQAFYIIHPKGPFLLDVFQCKSKAQVTYANSKSALTKVQAKTLDMLGMPNQPHAIKIIHQNTTFLKIKGQRSYIRWIPMDSQKQTGMGYIKYQIGNIKYEGDLLNINVNWGSLYSDKETKTLIKSIDYVIIISDNQQKLKDAINCQNYESPSLMNYHYKAFGSDKIRQNLSLPLSKMDIVSKYSDKNNLYLNIVANVQLFLPYQKQENHQHYRFVYAQQELPLQLFKQIHVSSDNILMIILIVSASLFFISCCCIICIKKIAPFLSKLRTNNVLAEEDGNRQKSDNFQQVPASSDRGKVHNNNMATQDRMSQEKQVPQIHK